MAQLTLYLNSAMLYSTVF
uniref:Uncharacterized protein LOC104210173 n=1 Tax=Nicotiana sylvestris TaxID=4096 RepID=A0A1U7V4Y2_NICSY